jgi:hypothetical protein
MRLPRSLCFFAPLTPENQNNGLEDTAFARQRLGKHGSVATNTHATEEPLDAVFSE